MLSREGSEKGVSQSSSKHLSSLSSFLVERVNSSLAQACPSIEGFKFVVQVREAMSLKHFILDIALRGFMNNTTDGRRGIFGYWFKDSVCVSLNGIGIRMGCSVPG